MRTTIVTISYNQAKYLEQAIVSVLSQSYPHVEYIVADGGSTDGSLEILKKYRKRFTKLFIGPDGGPANALNQAFGHATGEILGFLNSDDVLLPNALETVVQQFAVHPESGFLSGHCLITDVEGRILRRAYSDRFTLRRYAYGGCILLQPATFFRNELYQATNGFAPSNRVSWDADLFLEFGRLGAKHLLVEAYLAEYRLHQTSITAGQPLQAQRQLRQEMRLRRYLGRELRFYDRWQIFFYRYWRKLLNPRDTLQRILHGRIGGRYARV